MGEVVGSTVAVSSSSLPVKEDEERYVKVASRFFRVKPATGAGARAHHHHHFLDSCFLCKKSISSDRDIFMYNGDAAFCDEECRQEQMAMDEALRAVARRRRVMLHRKQATDEPVASCTAQREAAAAAERAPPMMHRRPTMANLGAARTPVAAS
ncbi:unnamed protein product [Alopecurus aequalis]